MAKAEIKKRRVMVDFYDYQLYNEDHLKSGPIIWKQQTTTPTVGLEQENLAPMNLPFITGTKLISTSLRQ